MAETRGSLARLVQLAIVFLPIHLAFQWEMIARVLAYHTSAAVRLYGLVTLLTHWTVWSAAFVVVARWVPLPRRRVAIFVGLSCGLSVFTQIDWMAYRNVQMHVLGFVRAGLFAQDDALATAGLTASALVFPVLQIGVACLIYIGIAVCTRRIAPGTVARLISARWAIVVGLLAAIALADRGAYVYTQRRDNYFVAELGASIPFYLLPQTERILDQFIPRQRELAELTERLHADTPARIAPMDYPDRVANVAPTRRPNILFVVLESFRADSVDSRYMPTLARLADESIYFRSHFSNSTATHFGLFSLLYSVYPAAWWQMQQSSRAPLPLQTLRAVGYRTIGVSSSSLGWYGMDEFMFTDGGFDIVHDEHNMAERAKHDPDNAYRADIDAVEELVKQLEGASDPAFGFLFLNCTHYPYRSPPEDRRFTPVFEQSGMSDLDFSDHHDELVNSYRNSLIFADKLIGRLVNAIDLDNTILVITGDHGEEFGEFGSYTHTGRFVDPQFHVPLIIRVPGEKAREIDALSSHVDVFPTVFARMGIRLDGAGLEWLGRDLLDSPRKFFLAGAANVDSPQPSRFALVNGSLKLVFRVIGKSLRVYDVRDRLDRRVNRPLSHPAIDQALADAREIIQNVNLLGGRD